MSVAVLKNLGQSWWHCLKWQRWPVTIICRTNYTFEIRWSRFRKKNYSIKDRSSYSEVFFKISQKASVRYSFLHKSFRSSVSNLIQKEAPVYLLSCEFYIKKLRTYSRKTASGRTAFGTAMDFTKTIQVNTFVNIYNASCQNGTVLLCFLRSAYGR